MLKVLLGLVMVTGLVACDQDPYPDRTSPVMIDPTQQVKATQVPTIQLATPDGTGLSHTSFSVSLNPSVGPKKVLIPIHFNSGAYNQIVVTQTSVTSEGCATPATTSTYPIADSNGDFKQVPKLYYNEGPTAVIDDVNLLYGQQQALTPASDEFITIPISADNKCTHVAGVVDTQLKTVTK